MKKFKAFLGRHLNTWDEICTDEGARLRTNTILFTFIVSWFYVVMFVADVATGHWQLAFVSAFLLLGGVGVFVAQFSLPQYSPFVAGLFGLVALVMSAYLLYSGGMGGFSFIWIFLVPHIAVMVMRLRFGIVFNCILVGMVAVMLNTPLSQVMNIRYGPVFGVLLPLALVFVSLVIYMAELVRYKIQDRLNVTAAKLQSFAFTDPLTGAYNRYAMASHFGDLSGNAYGLSFAILDLDFFKRINDMYGHMTGDDILCHIVDRVQENIPPGALLYRWGGEEFCLILKTAHPGEALDILEAVRHRVANAPYRQPDGNLIPVTISIGTVTGRRGEPISACIAEADKCLYAAKDAGRNKVVGRD